MAESLYPPVARNAADLSHIPGETGWPVLGQTLDMMYKPDSFPRALYNRYGPMCRGQVFFERAVHLFGPDANQFALANSDGAFSAYGGWEPILGRLFPRGLMLRDGHDHRSHRRIMQAAFKKDALAQDLEIMRPLVDARISDWGRNIRFYDEIKQLTLSLASSVFLGVKLKADADRVNQAFVDVVEASMAVLKLNLPGTLFGRGLKSRAYLERFFADRIAARRGSPTPDLFSRLCSAEDEHGEHFTDREIIDHMIFTMMAAHDTTTSALTSINYQLAKHPDWQAKAREEVCGVGESLAYDDLEKLELSGHIFREALRITPPLPAMLRRTVKDSEFGGYFIPAGTAVNLFNRFTHHMPEFWDAPERFDPGRFARNEHRKHKFQYIPFGAGAHTCIGMHFAEIQVKCVMHALLRRYRLSVPDGYEVPLQVMPITKPQDGLPLTLEPV